MDDLISALQWPAMVVTLGASWLVASQDKRKRGWGFWCFIVSNVLWVAWGLHDGAYALIALQVGLFVLNVRGARKNDPEKADAAGASDERGAGTVVTPHHTPAGSAGRARRFLS